MINKETTFDMLVKRNIWNSLKNYVLTHKKDATTEEIINFYLTGEIKK